MSDMIVVKCDMGSKAATVLCPKCSRISRQILDAPFQQGVNNQFRQPHTCPICRETYKKCNSYGAEAWGYAFSQYSMDSDTYNSVVKEKYNQKVAAENRIDEEINTNVETNPRVDISNSDKEEFKPDSVITSTSNESSLVETSDIVKAKECKKSDGISVSKNYRDAEAAASTITLMDRKIDHWEKELLDTSKKNKMINYRETKRQTLKILSPEAEELFNQLAFSEKRLSFMKPLSKDSDLRTYAVLSLLETMSCKISYQKGDIDADGTVLEREKTLKNLRSKAKLAQEEQGTNILYLSFGFIYWKESTKESSPWIKSPLLMMPVQLELKSINAPYTIRRADDEIEVNPTLDYLYNQSYGIDLPTFSLKDRKSFDDYFSTVEKLIDKKGWKLTREVSLGLLSFLKISMYHDLHEHRDELKENSVIKAMTGDRSALKDLPKDASKFDFDKTKPTEWYEVVDSDSSQQEAIMLSKKGVSFVMQGPPGTGKSQTITNIIAEALGDGKKVLFVSEKAAALQVVLKRLTESNLDDFCLALHSNKANKKDIVDNIGANLDLVSDYDDRLAKGELARLSSERNKLNKYANSLHLKREPFGESIYSGYGRLELLRGATDVEFKIDGITSISMEEYQAQLVAVRAFEKALHSFSGKLSDNPWAYSSTSSTGQIFRREFESNTDGLLDELIHLETSMGLLDEKYGVKNSVTWADSFRCVDDMKEVLDLPLFPVDWLEEKTRKKLRERAIKEEKIDQTEHARAKKLADLVKTLNSSWDMNKLHVSIAKLGDAFSNRDIWDGSEEAKSLAACNDECMARINGLINELSALADGYDQAIEMLSIKANDSYDSVLMISHIVNLLIDARYLESRWFDVRNRENYESMIRDAKEHQALLNDIKADVLKTWEVGIFDIDSSGMLARFKTEYTKILSFVKPSYKEDINCLKLHSKTVGVKIENTLAIDILQKVEAYKSEEKWFDENDEWYRSVFPNHYNGINTDWDQIFSEIDRALNIAEQFPYSNISEEVIASIQNICGSIQLLAEIRRLSDVLNEARINSCEEELGKIGLAFNANSDSFLRNDILRSVNELAEMHSECGSIIKLLDAATRGGVVSFGDVRLLVANAESARTECIWFKENIPDLVNELRISTKDIDEISAVIEQANIILEIHDAVAEKDETEELTSLFGNRYTGNFTDWQGILNDIELIEKYSVEKYNENMRSFINQVSADKERRDESLADISEIIKLRDMIEPGLVYLGNLFPASSFENQHIQDVIAKVNSCHNGIEELNCWLDYVDAKSVCDELGLSNFANEIARLDNSVFDVYDSFQKGFYTQWINEHIAENSDVRSFRKSTHEVSLDQFVKIDKKQFDYSRDRIRQNVIDSFPDKYSLRGASSEVSTLLHEMEKKRRVKPLRQLFKEIPHLLLTLKPCLMMSPLSVAYFLNAQDYHFDLVIFDEASQIFPQDAIGAIFRADQVVIAGDTKQLPPTNFFSSSTSNNNDDYDDNDDEYLEEEYYDSILEETASVLPNRTLLWHYRSKHEHLIAFSNKEIYKNQLVTFPSNRVLEPDSGVEFIHVKDGYYESGKRNNILEAKKCVELVKEHIEKHPERSLGIIAFSEAQQQSIASEIQKFREENSKNRKYEEFFSEDKEDEFFVKNLENVQGDERDTIIFSVGYAKTRDQIKNGKAMAMRFGPLGNSGGERRLNVAITRAKNNVKLVSSILPSDIDLNRTESEGVKMLRSYIEFAMNGGVSIANEYNGGVPDEFVEAVSILLENRGYRVRKYVGCSGYRIDIAIEHPEIDGEYVAGIECDGISYSSAKTARDRDRLRKTILTNMGWKMYRVWSTEWHQNYEIESNRLLEFVENSIAEYKPESNALSHVAAMTDVEPSKTIVSNPVEVSIDNLAVNNTISKKPIINDDVDAKKSADSPITVKKTANVRPENYTRSNSPAKLTGANKAVGWIKTGVLVINDHSGRGVITSVDAENNLMTVKFPNVEKTFEISRALASGSLRKMEDNCLNEVKNNEVDSKKNVPVKGISSGPLTESQIKARAKRGVKVNHKRFGSGVIHEVDDDYVTVDFYGIHKDFSLLSIFTNGLLAFEDESVVEESKPVKLSNVTSSSRRDSNNRAASISTKDSLLADLDKAGFEYIDNRNVSSILWVLYRADKEDVFEQIASKHKASFRLERRGSVATKDKAAWFVSF